MMLREEGMNQVQPSFRSGGLQGDREVTWTDLQGESCLPPQAFSKGCWCEIQWCRSQKATGLLDGCYQ